MELLWTGGWDSTWRLMTLLLVHRLPVQTTYLRDDARASMPIEIDTMERIRNTLAERYPITRRLLLPTRIVPVVGPPPDDDIQQAFRRLMRTYWFGDQYAFLARFCRDYGLQDVELSIEWATSGTPAVLTPHMMQTLTPHGLPTWKLRPDCDADMRIVFGAYAFPLLETHKPDMADDVVLREWTDVMAMTWFCHRPSKHMRPCGFCNPCQYVVEEGFSWRIPRSRRALSKLYGHTLWPLRGRARQWLQQWKTR